MSKIAKQKIWGEFPNLRRNKKRIYFNLNYKPHKRSNKKTEYPDIGICTVDDKNAIISYDIAVELKIKFENEPIKKDLDKLFHYLHPNKGKIEYDIAAFVVVPKINMNNNGFRIFLKKMNNIKREFSQKINEPNSNIFFCWVDLQGNVGYFWITFMLWEKVESYIDKLSQEVN